MRQDCSRQKAAQPQLAFAKSPRREMPMAKPRIRRVNRALAPLREIAAREVQRPAPAIFDSSKRNSARQKAALDIAHRQIRATRYATMATGFETTEALQHCLPAADDGAAPNDALTDLTHHPDNKPAPQATA
jgi:hypothetical protein